MTGSRSKNKVENNSQVPQVRVQTIHPYNVLRIQTPYLPVVVTWVIHRKVEDGGGRERGDLQGPQITRVQIQALMGYKSRASILSCTT